MLDRGQPATSNEPAATKEANEENKEKRWQILVMAHAPILTVMPQLGSYQAVVVGGHRPWWYVDGVVFGGFKKRRGIMLNRRYTTYRDSGARETENRRERERERETIQREAKFCVGKC